MTREEAIKKIKEAMPTMWKDIEEAIQTVIPELFENENERMVRKIESFLSAYGLDYFTKDELLEVENWLEKQKEEKPAEWDKLQEDFRNINEAFEDGKKEVIEHPEKYGLQKEKKETVNIDNFKSFMLQYLQDAANRKDDSEIEADTDKWAQKLLSLIGVEPKKPVVFDEDTELGLDRALQIVKSARGNLCGYQSDDGIYECDHAIGVLENILNNGIVQKVTEWKPDDIDMWYLKSIIDRVPLTCREQGALERIYNGLASHGTIHD